jgi:hypothetical protein
MPITEAGIIALDFRGICSLNLTVTQFRRVLLPSDLLDENQISSCFDSFETRVSQIASGDA